MSMSIMRIILIFIIAMNSITSHPARPPRRHAAAGLRYRCGVAARAVAAVGGSYLLASLSTQALALALPLPPVDRVVTATLSGLAIYPCAAMWAFAAASAARAWLGLGAACALVQIALLALRAAAGGGA